MASLSATMVRMDVTLGIVISGVVGLFFGSFAGASVWRLRASQLASEKARGEVPEDDREYGRLSKLLGQNFRNDRSKCLECGHRLAWYDLVPLVSWISVAGRCRYCRAPIGYFEPIIELGMAIYCALSYAMWHGSLMSLLGVVQFVLWIICGVLLAILFAYDTKWFLLPNTVVFPFIGLSALFALISIIADGAVGYGLLNIFESLMILSGLYFALWWISHGRWIGLGDVKLGIGLAFLLADWRLAFIALFVANALGSLLVLPGIVAKKIGARTRVPFGPFLIAGMFIAFVLGDWILERYFFVY